MTSRTHRVETRLKSVFGFKNLPFAKDGDVDRFFETEAFLQARTDCATWWTAAESA